MIINGIIQSTPKEKRDLFFMIEEYLEKNNKENKAVMIFGNRRVGKTVILNNLKNRFNKSVLIEVSHKDSFEDIYNFINNNIDRYELFLIDEFTNSYDVYLNARTLIDSIFRSGKKVVITGTESLALFDLSESELFGRVKMCRLLNPDFLEYCRLFNYSENLNSFEKYMKSGSLLLECDGLEYVNNISNDMSSSIMKIMKRLDLSCEWVSLEKIKFYVVSILFKVVWRNIKKERILSVEGISDKEVLDKVDFEIRKITGFYGDINREEFLKIFNFLRSLDIIAAYNPIIDGGRYKLIIPNFAVKVFIYEFIENVFNIDLYKEYKITHYGNMFENILNTQTYLILRDCCKILNTDLQLNGMNFEVDETIYDGDKVLLVEYKNGDLRENKFFTYIKSGNLQNTGLDIEMLYVTKDKENKDFKGLRVMDFVEFLRFLRNIKNEKEKQLYKGLDFNWD